MTSTIRFRPKSTMHLRARSADSNGDHRNPLPLACGRGQGEGSCDRSDGRDPWRAALTPTLSRERERENWKSSMTQRVLILDFGSQVTQLIARRVRESGVYCEILPYNTNAERIAAFAPAAIILSGGPASVNEAAAPLAPQTVFEMGVPVLGLCYGQQAM